MSDILERIYAGKAHAAAREEAAEPFASVRERAAARGPGRRGFTAAISGARGPAIIGEIKRASPSSGIIAPHFDPGAIAAAYDAGGIDAISVLTESQHFLGELAFLDVVRARCSCPLLRKDFLTTPYQVAQSAAYGADAILLIVAGLSDEALSANLAAAREFGLDALVEIHDAHELERAVKAGAALIGINNRNLRTFETDLGVSERLLPMVPREVMAISESGLRKPADVARLYGAGARGFLVGEALMRAERPAEIIRELKTAVEAIL